MTNNIERPKMEAKVPIKAPISFRHGPVIGHYMGSVIYEYLIDNFGIKRIFTGTAPDASSIPPRAIFTRGQVYEIEKN